MRTKLLSTLLLLGLVFSTEGKASDEVLNDEILGRMTTSFNRFSECATFISYGLKGGDAKIGWEFIEKHLHAAMQKDGVAATASEEDLNDSLKRLSGVEKKVESFGPMGLSLKTLLWSNFEKQLFSALSETYGSKGSKEISFDETPSFKTGESSLPSSEDDEKEEKVGVPLLKIDDTPLISIIPVIEQISFATVMNDLEKKKQFSFVFGGTTDRPCIYKTFEGQGNKKAAGVKFLNKNWDRVYSLVNGWQKAFGDDQAYQTVAGEMNRLLQESYGWIIADWAIPNNIITQKKSILF